MSAGLREGMKKRVEQLKTLPSSPAVLHPLLELLRQPVETIELKRVVELVSYDKTIAAQCLRIANSSLCGRMKETDSVQAAVLTLGIERIEDILLTCCLQRFSEGADRETDLVAEAVHALSARANQPFVVVNCAAIPEALLEAELFGHARGAFTGAVQSRLGRIHVAQGGTLVLDEIGELPLGMQAKLLRFLQCGEVQRLGSTDVHRVDVRVVCATNVELERLVEAKQFRKDLYYR